MASVLGACTKLEKLAIDMPFLDVDHLPQLEDGFRRDVNFAAILTVISAIPTLRALRILNIVEVDLDDDDFEKRFPSSLHLALRKIPMQKLANHILRFMTRQGSDLKVLSFKHSYLDMKWEIEEKFRDGKGRQWPEYHYCRGRTTDITGTNDVMIAHRSKDIVLEYPDLTRFFGHVF
ncbi:hypothetical protein ACET3X_006278 [Alternaria dauci]|uniref:F-box domain-containing protein n=1 Tax=Alternaria dauci TaxID=48095 RepID=A0ABR3UKB1_9PLEO